MQSDGWYLKILVNCSSFSLILAWKLKQFCIIVFSHSLFSAGFSQVKYVFSPPQLTKEERQNNFYSTTEQTHQLFSVQLLMWLWRSFVLCCGRMLFPDLELGPPFAPGMQTLQKRLCLYPRWCQHKLTFHKSTFPVILWASALLALLIMIISECLEWRNDINISGYILEECIEKLYWGWGCKRMSVRDIFKF